MSSTRTRRARPGDPTRASPRNWRAQGFITFAPHNFYRGKDDFRVIQRKLNLTGKTLFSVIIGQHQRILEWLKAQPDVDPKRIAFYGLSYGGKSAMRIPAVLTDYCLCICSGDFNEWVRKCVSLDMPMSYVFTQRIRDLGMEPRPHLQLRGDGRAHRPASLHGRARPQ